MHTRDLSLRSTSEHMVSSDSSLAELSSARMLSASRSGSPERRAVPAIGQVSTWSSFHAHEHFRRCAHQLLIAHLQNEFVGAGTRFLNPLEKFRRALRERRAEGLPQHTS
jgi:hypothetical protein